MYIFCNDSATSEIYKYGHPLSLLDALQFLLQLRLGVAVPAELPLVIHVGGEFYFKGESVGRVWLSPHDETPTGAHDAAPDEMDVAIAIERMQAGVDWPVAAGERQWAGLRSVSSAERRGGGGCGSKCRPRGWPVD